MESSELDELYQEIILDHNRRPHNLGKLDQPTHTAEGFHPLCGDELTLYLEVVENRVQNVSFEGQGCAISRASASLMTQRVKGKTVNEAQKILSEICTLLGSEREPTAIELEEMGDLAALSGVRKFPARIKCATLPWHTLKAALQGKNSISIE